MTVTATPIFPQTIKNTTITIVPADTQAFKVAYTGGANGSKIEYWSIASNDTAAHDISVNLTISATNYLISTVNIPIGAGFTGTVPAFNVLTSAQLPGIAKDSNGNPYLYIASGTTLTISCLVTVTAAKTITSTVQAGDY